MLTAVGTASAQGAPKERYQFDSDLPPTEVPPSNLKVSIGGVNLAVLTAASVRHHFAARAKAAHILAVTRKAPQRVEKESWA